MYRLEKTREKQQDGLGQLQELKVEKEVIQATLLVLPGANGQAAS